MCHIKEPEDGMLFSRADLKKLLIPLIAEQLLSYLIGMMDSVMVSSAGEAAVSAVALVDSISILFIQIFAALATGGAVVAGQYLGRKDPDKARCSAEQLMVILVIISVGITAVLLAFQSRILNLLFGKIDHAVMENCKIYYSIVMYSIPCIALYNGGAALFRSVGDSRTPLYISLLMNLINIAGNAVLIFIFRLGVAGVAIPTLISRALGMLAILALSFNKRFTLNLCHMHHYHPDWHLISNVLSIGIPGGIENGMFQFGKMMLMSLVSSLSLAEVTANAIGNAVGNFQGFVALAVNIGSTTVISRCVGAGDYQQARWYEGYLVKYTYIYQGLVSILFCLGIPLILKIYGVSADTARFATIIMLIHGIGLGTLWPLAFMYNNAMRAAGDSRYVMIVASVSMWVCRVGGAYFLILGLGFSVLGVWIAWMIDWVFRICFFIPRYCGHKWETKAIA